MSMSCIKIENVFKLRSEISIECYNETHLYLLIFVSIPSLILWIVGIPMVLVSILIRNKDTLDMSKKLRLENQEELSAVMTFKTRYGYLTNGYKSESYYIEIINFYKKAILYAFS